MPIKVKRGLGLLVVALLTWLLVLALSQADAGYGTAATVLNVFVLLLALGLIAAFLGGLVLIAWGLLRD